MHKMLGKDSIESFAANILESISEMTMHTLCADTRSSMIPSDEKWLAKTLHVGDGRLLKGEDKRGYYMDVLPSRWFHKIMTFEPKPIEEDKEIETSFNDNEMDKIDEEMKKEKEKYSQLSK